MLVDLQLIVYSYLELEEALVLTKDKFRENVIKRLDISNLDVIAEYRSGNIQTVKYLINNGNLIRLSELITSVAVKGDLLIIKAIQQKVASYDVYQLYFHATHSACYYGHLHILKYFVSVGQKLRQDHLHSAIRHGHLEIVKYLTSLGIVPVWKIIKKIRIQNEEEIIGYLKQSHNSCCIIL